MRQVLQIQTAPLICTCLLLAFGHRRLHCLTHGLAGRQRGRRGGGGGGRRRDEQTQMRMREMTQHRSVPDKLGENSMHQSWRELHGLAGRIWGRSARGEGENKYPMHTIHEDGGEAIGDRGMSTCNGQVTNNIRHNTARHSIVRNAYPAAVQRFATSPVVRIQLGALFPKRSRKPSSSKTGTSP